MRYPRRGTPFSYRRAVVSLHFCSHPSTRELTGRSYTGAVGSFIIQMAKAEGLKVITSAGTEDKIAFAKECGADVVFNYKTENTAEILQKEGPINMWVPSASTNLLPAAEHFVAQILGQRQRRDPRCRARRCRHRCTFHRTFSSLFSPALASHDGDE